MRGCEVVVNGRIEVVERNGLAERPDGKPMAARRLVDETEKIETSDVTGRAGEDLLAENFGLRGLPLLMRPNCIGHLCGDVAQWRRRGGFAARQSEPTLFSVHAVRGCITCYSPGALSRIRAI